MHAPLLGIIFAFVALVAWGFGDFFIQRSVRRIGIVAALFWIGVTAAFGLLPFVWADLPAFFASRTGLERLIAAALAMLLAALLQFTSLKDGKIATLEPLLGLELVFTAAIGMLLLGERFTILQAVLALVILAGILLTITRRDERTWWERLLHEHQRFEEGVLLMVAGACVLALVNIFSGLASRATSPLVTVWFMHTTIALVLGVSMALHGSLPHTLRSVRPHWRIVLAMVLFDNIAWIAFTSATSQQAIALTIAITQSYIPLAVLLGVVWNRERLQRHQFAGIILAILGGLVLAVVSAQ